VSVQVHVADLADPGHVAELERVVAAAEPDLLVNKARFGGYREFCYVDPQVVPIWLACTCWRSADWPGRRYRP
jgi:short-subunit dehydrogenase